MTDYLLAQVQLKYGPANLARYQAAMATVREFFESQNIKLVAGTVTRVGPLYEAFNLWQIEDQGHHARALDAIMSANGPQARAVLAELSATVEHEQMRFLETLPFGDASHRL
jgi:NIPSNAP